MARRSMFPRFPLRQRLTGPVAGAFLLVALACSSRATAGVPAAPEAGTKPVAVRVERLRPSREALPTLRFLKTNRDFFRSRLDQLREAPLTQGDDARAIDPRFLAYRTMMNEALAASDTLGAAASEREHHQLLASVSEFSRLESELDMMERVLAGQGTRLTALQADFTGRQRTALAIVVSGYPQGADLSTLTLRFDDGSTREAAITPAEREALAHGGVLELFHGLVEPREQVLEVALAGEGLASAEPGFVSLDPTCDRLMFLRFDLSPVRLASGAPAMVASTWLLDDALSANGGAPSRP
jgi:hypothetical protein